MKSLRDYRGSALPGFLSFSVLVQFFNKIVASKWAGPAMEVFEEIKKEGVEMVKRAIQAKCTTPSIAAFMQHAFWTGLQPVAESAKLAVRALLKDESLPSTQNHYYFENVQKLRHAPMTNAIKKLKTENGSVDQKSVLAILQRTSNMSNEEHEVQ